MADNQQSPTCPKCKRQMMPAAYLPPYGDLPGVESYQCIPCSEEVSREVE